jgi:peptidoglycan hydrolase-like protein with peptidoglycan-binding domain
MRQKLTLFLLGMLLLGAMVALSGFSPSVYAATVQSQNAIAHLNSAQPLACPVLSLGDGGSAVSVLQEKLNYFYQSSDPRWFRNSPDDFKPPLEVDGSFGSLTRNAVIDYQSWNGLQVDGIVGSQTWGSLGGC